MVFAIESLAIEIESVATTIESVLATVATESILANLGRSAGLCGILEICRSVSTFFIESLKPFSNKTEDLIFDAGMVCANEKMLKDAMSIMAMTLINNFD